MKLSQLSILFVAILVFLLAMSNTKTENLRATSSAKHLMDERMESAVEDAANTFLQINSSKEYAMNKEDAADTFFNSLFASLGITSDPIMQDKVRAYTPLILVTQNEGYYLYYCDEYIDEDGAACITRRWTELMPYTYEDSNFIYRFTLDNNIVIYDKNKLLDSTGQIKNFDTTLEELRESETYKFLRTMMPENFIFDEELFPLVRQQSIINCIEEDMSWYVSHYNDFAEYYGITYNFSVPVSNISEWTETIKGPGVLVIFQGMPLWEDGDIIYNNIAFSGGGIQYGTIYYIEQKEWYYIYHKDGCPELENNSNISEKKYYSAKSCIELGAYGCEQCDPTSVHVPEYSY